MLVKLDGFVVVFLALFWINTSVFVFASGEGSASANNDLKPRGRFPRALRGKPGKPGPRGPPGAKGEDGEAGKAGMPGFPGPVGPKGFQGAPGDRGTRGDQGDAGETGPRGLPGKIIGCINHGSSFVCLDGPTGKQGVKGAQGKQGDVGPKGQRGYPGLKGNKGKKGRRGASGLPGLPGSIGGPHCTARYTEWVRMDDFVGGKQGMMCGDLEFLWNVITETENDKLRIRYHCCKFLQIGIRFL